MALTTCNLSDGDVVGAELWEWVELISCEFDSESKLTFVISSPGEDLGVKVIINTISLDVHNGVWRSRLTSRRG